MKNFSLKILFILLALGSVKTVFAHHSFAAEFDIDTPVSLIGKVTEVKWSNPHGWIYMNVEDADGNVVNWALETSAANNLIRRGWRKTDLALGTVIQVEGFQARNGKPTANIRAIVLEDGRSMFSGNAED